MNAPTPPPSVSQEALRSLEVLSANDLLDVSELIGLHGSGPDELVAAMIGSDYERASDLLGKTHWFASRGGITLETVDEIKGRLDRRKAGRAEVQRSLLARGQQGNTATQTDGASQDDLAAPTPLPKLPAVPEFPLDILPRDLAPWVADAAERARFRPDFAAASGMAALGSLIGRKLGIRLKQHDSWTEYGNIWAALIGDPGALKSPAQRDALRPLKALQVAADEKHQAEIEEYEARLEAFKLRRDAKRKSAVAALAKNAAATIDLGADANPEAPIARTYLTSDATAKKLGVLLAQNPDGLLVERDAVVFPARHARGRTRRNDLPPAPSSPAGQATKVIGSTASSAARRHSEVRPDRGRRHSARTPGALCPRGAFSGERADGLRQRFQLIVWPDPAPFEYVDRLPNSRARQAVADLFDRADKLDAGAIARRDYFWRGAAIHSSVAAGTGALRGVVFRVHVYTARPKGRRERAN